MKNILEPAQGAGGINGGSDIMRLIHGAILYQRFMPPTQVWVLIVFYRLTWGLRPMLSYVTRAGAGLKVRLATLAPTQTPICGAVWRTEGERNLISPELTGR